MMRPTANREASEMAFLGELKRRNIFKVALFYAVAAFVILKLGMLVTHLLGIPAGVGGLLVALLAVGFPAALVFSWVYELTPDGLKLEREVDREESITRETGKKIDRMTAVLAVVGVLIVIIDRLIVR